MGKSKKEESRKRKLQEEEEDEGVELGTNTSNSSDEEEGPVEPSKKAKKETREDKVDRKKRMEDEDRFIAGVVHLMYIPKHRGLDGGDDEDSEDDDDQHGLAKARNKLFGTSSRASTVEELQERLRTKMLQLKGNRNEGKHSKRKGAQQKAKLTKVEKKQKAREEKKLKKKLVQQSLKGNTPAGGKEGGKKANGHMGKQPAVYNAEGKVVFSKFDFTEENATGDGVGKKKKGKIDPKSALQKITKHKEKIKSLNAIGKRAFLLKLSLAGPFLSCS